MGFLDKYLDNHSLDKISDSTKENLSKLEDKLKQLIDENSSAPSFDNCLEKFGPQIADLVERLSKYVAGFLPFSWRQIPDAFRFVYSIALEVSQIVNGMSACVIKPGMTAEQKRQAKLDMGKQLTLFVWSAVGPLDKVLNWIPFKATIEKRLVLWLAGLGLNAAMDLFDNMAPKLKSTHGSKGKSLVLYKAIPN